MASSFLAEDSVLVDYKSDIEEMLTKEQSPDCDMAKYVGEQSGIGNRLILAEWNVEEVGDTLYGRIDCYLDGKLDKSELEKLREALIGQCSDGIGESVEQRPATCTSRSGTARAITSSKPRTSSRNIFISRMR